MFAIFVADYYKTEIEKLETNVKKLKQSQQIKMSAPTSD